ncbi:M14 family zinc carboxypeptidase [Catenovulum sediminis]|uniref:M14 family zinc carboxypeptidase n=1 Tax=Catenovulum sediminis TaxID=1740262 RepID=UPI00117C566C|nr:M14 family zinc carboxypeptidase [Catenovulum sediminis]
MPIIIWLSFASHGDEPSGTRAAIDVIHQLLSDNTAETRQWLNDSVILFEVIANPDGYDRFASQANTFYSDFPTANKQHMGRAESWPGGRGNHYWFDLNRDWLPITQIESIARVKEFQRWKPNLLADFHEMQADHSYFFQPGVAERINPLTPERNIELTKTLSDYTARAFDQQQKLFFSEERFDDFYIGKGSTYPDLQGSLGILLEQANSRGQILDTINGKLTFQDTVDNQKLAIWSMLRAANAKREALLSYQEAFFKSAITKAKAHNIKGFLIQEKYNKSKLNAFLQLLNYHAIQAYPLKDDYQSGDHLFEKAHSYWIPLQQAQFSLIQSIFSRQTSFSDHTFYDVTNWNLALSYGIQYQEVDKGFFGVKPESQAWRASKQKNTNVFQQKALAYLIEWHDSKAAPLLAEMLKRKIAVRVTEKDLNAVTPQGSKAFSSGSLLVLAADNSADKLREFKALLQEYNVMHFNLVTGHTPQGPDLGSIHLVPLALPKAAILAGSGVSITEVGEVWFHFDKKLHLPLVMLDKTNPELIDLNHFSHLIMVDGDYQSLPSILAQRIINWVEDGGTLITTKRATLWASQQRLIRNEFLSESDLMSEFNTDQLKYADKDKLLSEMRISGTVFNSQLDSSHPLTFAYYTENLPIFRNDRVMLLNASQPFLDVIKYTDSPLLAGYASKENVKSLRNTTALTAQSKGKGQVIAFTDNPLFRGYWYATERLLTNALYFSHLLQER